MDIKHVNSQVIGGYVERLKHLLQRHLLVSRLGNESHQFTDQKISTILQPCRRERRHLSSVSSWWTSRGVSGSCRKRHEYGCPPEEVISQTRIFFPPFWHCRSLCEAHSSAQPTLSTHSGVHEVHTLRRNKNHIHQLFTTLCLLGLQIGEPSVAEALERAISNHCTKVLHVPHKSGQVRHLQSLFATCILEEEKITSKGTGLSCSSSSLLA